ncbi:Ig-like domain-containing protein [Hymenobacter metallicola]|uniref:PKD/Chitinase domain-containing protein n=1 Tax=Hymenobacter metallicola TaxID=2563114 RepID=A0A4Z0QKL8_9BACT|nr:Ig-like domain-containing protein [Hymenobacter metallicola]TGE29793.1 hypothetical protein E5K02_10140 [Hymenobacter metallicola]
MLLDPTALEGQTPLEVGFLPEGVLPGDDWVGLFTAPPTHPTYPGKTFEVTQADQRKVLAPRARFEITAPSNAFPATAGVENQLWLHKRGGNKLDWYQYQAGVWVLVYTTDETDNKLPVVTLDVSVGAITLGQKVTLNATASDPDGSIIVVEFYQGQLQIGRATSPPYAIEYKPTAVGGFTFTAKATDSQGAASVSAPKNISVVAANQVPTLVTLNVPVTTLALGGTLPLTAVVTAGTYGVDEVTFFDGATPLNDPVLTAPYAFDWKPTTPGNHALTAKVLDLDGNTTISSVVNIFVTAAPATSTITTSLSASSVVAGQSVVLKVAATAPSGVDSVEFLIDGNSLGLKTVKEASGLYELVYTPATAGTKVFTARALDNNGETITAGGKNITVTAANLAPVVTAFSATTATSIAAGGTVTVQATATDSDGTVASIRIYDGAALVGTITGASGSTTTSALAAGNHTLTAKAYDGTAEGAAFGTTILVTATAPLPTYSHFLAADNNGGTGLDGMVLATEGPRKLEFNQKSTTADPQVLTITDGGVTSYVNWSGDYKGDSGAWYDGAGVRHEFAFPNPAADFTLSY